MREILFRGKSLDFCDWLCGYIRQYQNGKITIYDFEAKRLRFVDPSTVGQFTGLADKNGKKIFEGDLLNGFEYPFYRSEDNKHNYFAEVVWFDNGAFGLVTHKYPNSRVRGISAGNADYFDEEFECDNWEVIGNIHDNPELLEG